MKKRIYIRVRAAQQEEGRSQGAQEDACRRSVDSEGCPTVLPGDVPSDLGSGDDQDRSVFRELRRRIADGVYDPVFVHTVDRLDSRRNNI